MSSLLVITGPPGAGKSTVASLVADRFETSALVEGDAFFAFLAAGAIDPWLPESSEQNGVVIDAAARATAAFVEGGYDTVYDGVVGPWFLPRFAAGLGVASLDYAILLPPVEVCVERVATRTGHGFSDEPATRKMHHEFSRSEVDDRHVLPGRSISTSASPRVSAEVVAETILKARAAGRLRWVVADQ